MPSTPPRLAGTCINRTPCLMPCMCALLTRRQSRHRALGERAAAFTAIYSKYIYRWQRAMAEAGVQHDRRSLSYLMEALAATNRMSDALALAEALAKRRPGEGPNEFKFGISAIYLFALKLNVDSAVTC